MFALSQLLIFVSLSMVSSLNNIGQIRMVDVSVTNNLDSSLCYVTQSIYNRELNAAISNVCFLLIRIVTHEMLLLHMQKQLHK